MRRRCGVAVPGPFPSTSAVPRVPSVPRASLGSLVPPVAAGWHHRLPTTSVETCSVNPAGKDIQFIYRNL